MKERITLMWNKAACQLLCEPMTHELRQTKAFFLAHFDSSENRAHSHNCKPKLTHIVGLEDVFFFIFL